MTDQGNCVICGKPLKGRQTKFCSKECNSRFYHERKHDRCVVCGGEIPQGRKCFCSYECARKKKSESFDLYPHDQEMTRPYTQDTASIIRRWHQEGMSLEMIGRILRRSVENVSLALDMED